MKNVIEIVIIINFIHSNIDAYITLGLQILVLMKYLIEQCLIKTWVCMN